MAGEGSAMPGLGVAKPCNLPAGRGVDVELLGPSSRPMSGIWPVSLNSPNEGSQWWPGSSRVRVQYNTFRAEKRKGEGQDNLTSCLQVS